MGIGDHRLHGDDMQLIIDYRILIIVREEDRSQNKTGFPIGVGNDNVIDYLLLVIDYVGMVFEVLARIQSYQWIPNQVWNDN